MTEYPYCRYCEAAGRTILATVVDHIAQHNGDPVLFWDVDNWQPLCQTHHDATKQREEKTGRVAGCDLDGVPLDPSHHWRRHK